MFDASLIIVFALVCFGGGWYCCRKFGAKVAADVAVVTDTAKKL